MFFYDIDIAILKSNVIRNVIFADIADTWQLARSAMLDINDL